MTKAKPKLADGLQAGGELLIAVGAGRIAGLSVAHLSGAGDMPAIDTEYTIKQNPLEPDLFPSNDGELVAVVSSAGAADDSIILQISGLGEDFVRQSERVMLDALGEAISELKWTRINSIVNAGTIPFTGSISVEGTTTPGTFIVAVPKAQRSAQGILSIPSGHIGQILRLIATMKRTTGGDSNVALSLYIRSIVTGDVWTDEFTVGMQRNGSTTVDLTEDIPSRLDGPLDIRVTAITTAIPCAVLCRINVLVSEA